MIINDIKFIDKIVISPGCIYKSGRCKFRTLEAAVKHLKSIKPTGLTKIIQIINKSASNIIPENCESVAIKDVKDKFCIHSRLRIIHFSNNVDEVYIEKFSLADDNEMIYFNDFTFDYSILYDDNIPEYPTDKPYGKFISTILPFPITITENEYFYPKSKLDEFYTRDTDILQIFRSNVFTFEKNGSYYFHDFGYPWWSIPASTLRELIKPPKDLLIPKGINVNTYPYKPKQKIFDKLWYLIYKDRIC